MSRFVTTESLRSVPGRYYKIYAKWICAVVKGLEFQAVYSLKKGKEIRELWPTKGHRLLGN